MGRRRILLAVVSAAALWRATAMDDTDEFIAAAPAANPFDGTGHMSAGQLFYGDERAGRRSYAQRNYDWYTGPEGPGLEAYTAVISDFTQQMLSTEHWKDLRDRLIATLSSPGCKSGCQGRSDIIAPTPLASGAAPTAPKWP